MHAVLDKLVRQQPLREEEARSAMLRIMAGEATSAQIAAFVTALRMKGETVEEIAGCARAMRDMVTPVEVKGSAVALESDGLDAAEGIVVDTCGTGGDGADTFNISTAVAFVAAGAGLTVAKHGNRAVSSKCGSADVLERLGVNLALHPTQVKRCIDEIGIGFLFAPVYHLAMRHAAGPRRELAFRTVFNLLGPLANPAGANVQVLGVYAPDLTDKMAAVLARLGTRRALVVHGHGTQDEIALTGPTVVSETDGRSVRTYTVTPDDFGMRTVRAEDLAGGDADHNAAILRGVFNGESGPRADAVIVNAAAVFVVAGMAPTLAGGARRAREELRSGRPRAKLEALVDLSRRLAQA